MRVQLILIDPQNDFVSPNGALSVPKANEDMDRLASMIKRLGNKISGIATSLDDHHKLHIANAGYWINENGDNPPGDATTVITADDVKNNRWFPSLSHFKHIAIKYLEALEASGKYQHRIWPDHCLSGSEGAAVWSNLYDAFLNWESNPKNIIDYIRKGSNLHTEHFSALSAEIIDPNDPGTQVNQYLLDLVEISDVVGFAGEASTHCLASTIRDIVANLGNKEHVKKLHLIKDATSPIPGLESLEEDMIKDMTEIGMQLTTTKNFLNY